MTITIITVGAKPGPEITKLIQDYLSRLPWNVSVEFRYIKHAKGDHKSSKRSESENILKFVDTKNTIILLDETGEQLSSPQLSKKLFENPKDTTFIIGGAYGVNDAVKKKSDMVWSLGGLVYPHKLVRLILAEQIYRAHTISTNHPYHH